jgi:hypothetical protein
MEPTDVALLVSIQCSTCAGQIRLGDEHCPSCKRQVTRDESDALRRRWEGSDPEAARRGDTAAYGRVALLIVAGLSFIQAITYGLIGESLPVFAFCTGISGGMIALFFWGKRRPLAAMVVGLAVYLLLAVLPAMVSVMTLVPGILIRVSVVLALSVGIGSELSLRKREKALSRRR